ncbi:hypothetical protein Syun_005221 [Stephania yunnanensis]|uniref:Gustatory receptor n=1 Tax=Stephania yunnanensis TaxID=152371 RepID=A0AAP0Q391_9MAGN
MSRRPNGFLFHFTIFIILSTTTTSSSTNSRLQKQGHGIGIGRADPLRSFNSYCGGYQIEDPHYWTSAMFTGLHGFAVAGIWTLAGLGFGVFVSLKSHVNGSSSEIRGHSSYYYLLPFLVAIFFTLLAIGASGFVLAANHKAVQRMNRLKQALLQVAEDADRTILKVARAMQEMHYTLHPYDETTSYQLSLSSNKLENQSQTLRHAVYKHRHLLERSTRIWYGATAGIVSINLIFTIAGLVMLSMHWNSGLFVIIFFCWILTALCWVLTGFHFFLHTFAEDTCSAFEEFQRSPGHNSLNTLIPCADKGQANRIMIEIGRAVHVFISKLNLKIVQTIKILRLDHEDEALLRSGKWKICDPFSHDSNYTYYPDRCSKDSIPISDIPEILTNITCFKDNSTSSCLADEKFLSEASYKVALAYTRTIQDLFNIFPDLQKLAQCSFVKQAFTNILSHQCKPFATSVKFLWSSMISLSVIMVILELVWIVIAYQNRYRSFSWGPLIPR